MLRKERVTSILDVGCGDGNLLACLCNAPPWLSGSPDIAQGPGYPCHLGSNDNRQADMSPPSDPPPEDDSAFVHASRLVGLDICSDELEKAVEGTAPEDVSEADASPSAWTYTSKTRRWDSLEVFIWKGSFADYNPSLCDMDCIVSTEVFVCMFLPPRKE
jgi:hypothetical protein